MIKDTFFNMSRFINLCRKDVIENWRTNVLRVIMMYGVMTVFMVINAFQSYSRNYGPDEVDPVWRFALVALMWGMWIFGCLSASFTMEKMKTKTGRLAVLMNPATPFEKYFSRWFVYTIVFLIVFLLSFKFADFTRILICKLKYPELDMIAPVPLSHCVGENVPYFTLFQNINDFFVIISIYFFCQSCFVLGSSIWPKNAFIKTFAVGGCVLIVYILVAMGMSNLVFEDGKIVFGLLSSREDTGGILTVLVVLLTIVNWVIAYFRFKEAEIINRM